MLRYLYGPGRHNEHENPHLVAAWDLSSPTEWYAACHSRRSGCCKMARKRLLEMSVVGRRAGRPGLGLMSRGLQGSAASKQPDRSRAAGAAVSSRSRRTGGSICCTTPALRRCSISRSSCSSRHQTSLRLDARPELRSSSRAYPRRTWTRTTPRPMADQHDDTSGASPPGCPRRASQEPAVPRAGRAEAIDTDTRRPRRLATGWQSREARPSAAAPLRAAAFADGQQQRPVLMMTVRD